MGLRSEGVGFVFFFFFFSCAAYGSAEILRFLSKPRKCPVAAVIVPLENAEDLLALQCAFPLCYFRTRSDQREPDFIGAISFQSEIDT